MRKEQQKKLIRHVKSALEGEMQLSSVDIQVDAKEDIILLSGIVDTLAEKTFAEKVATQIEGVAKVENFITIGTDGTLTDDEITAHVEQHLHQGKDSENLDGVGVKVEGGSAVLMGRVDTLTDKNNALKAAQKAAGAKDVVSTIKLGPPHQDPLPDVMITNRIVQRYSTSGLSAPDIDVSTHEGTVSLKGYVEDTHMMELAEDLAMEVEGVKKLKNHLRIR